MLVGWWEFVYETVLCFILTQFLFFPFVVKQVQANKGGVSPAKNRNKRSKTGSKRPRIPYRDSKLTYLLRDSLGGNSKTVMLTTIRAPVAFYQQTKMSLMYASRAKNIRNQTHINTDSIGNSEMQQVVGQVEQLRMKLLERTGTCVVLVGMLVGMLVVVSNMNVNGTKCSF